jgi:hypothetical protein
MRRAPDAGDSGAAARGEDQAAMRKGQSLPRAGHPRPSRIMAGVRRGRKLFTLAMAGDGPHGLGKRTGAAAAGLVEIKAAASCKDAKAYGCILNVAAGFAPEHKRVQRQGRGIK